MLWVLVVSIRLTVQKGKDATTAGNRRPASLFDEATQMRVRVERRRPFPNTLEKSSKKTLRMPICDFQQLCIPKYMSYRWTDFIVRINI